MVEAECRQITVRRDGKRDFRFDGYLEASVSDHSSDKDYWQEYHLWKVKGGKYICQRVSEVSHLVQDFLKHRKFKAGVAEDVVAVEKFFGHDALAKELYDKMSWNLYEDID